MSDNMVMVVLETEVLDKTDLAFQIEVEGELVWIPFSMCESTQGIDNHVGTVWMEEWLAREKGFEYA